jgi:hypothetical protein
VTLADVQALLPSGSGVTENSTPDAGRCNFTWDDGGPRGIDVAIVPGGRAAFEAQSGVLPAGPDRLENGDAYETLDGLGDQAWAFGDGRRVSAVVLDGDDLIAADAVADGDPGGPATAAGLNAGLLELSTQLLELAVASRG